MSHVVRKLGGICLTTQGVQITKANTSDHMYEGGCRYLYIADFLSDSKQCFIDDVYDAKKVTSADLVMANTGSPGRVFRGKSGILSNNLFKISFSKTEVDRDYLFYILASDIFQGLLQKQMKGGIQKHLGHKTISRQKIPLPPIVEQQKIAAILDAADQLRQKDQKLIDHYTTLSQSLFLEMFGDPVENPKGFKRTTVVDVIKIVGGSQPAKSVFKHEPSEGYIRLVQIRDYKSDKYITYVPENSTKKFCTDRDIMIGRYGPPVFQILRGISGAYNVALMKAIPRSQMNAEYVFYLLCSSYIQNIVIGNSKRTAGQTGVNLKLLNGIEISLPPLELQEIFANRIEVVNQQKNLARLNLQNSESLFNSLLQRAFKGELTSSEAA